MHNFSAQVQVNIFKFGVEWRKRKRKTESSKRYGYFRLLLSLIESAVIMLCQMRWKSLILNDLEGHRQSVRSAIIATARFLLGCPLEVASCS